MMLSGCELLLWGHCMCRWGSTAAGCEVPASLALGCSPDCSACRGSASSCSWWGSSVAPACPCLPSACQTLLQGQASRQFSDWRGPDQQRSQQQPWAISPESCMLCCTSLWHLQSHRWCPAGEADAGSTARARKSASGGSDNQAKPRGAAGRIPAAGETAMCDVVLSWT